MMQIEKLLGENKKQSQQKADARESMWKVLQCQWIYSSHIKLFCSKDRQQLIGVYQSGAVLLSNYSSFDDSSISIVQDFIVSFLFIHVCKTNADIIMIPLRTCIVAYKYLTPCTPNYCTLQYPNNKAMCLHCPSTAVSIFQQYIKLSFA